MATLTELKPAYRLNVLIALALLGGPARKEAIADKASVSDETVQNALRWMADPERGLVLAIPAGRHPLWALAATARQMLLPIAQLVAGPDYEKLSPLPADSDGVVVVLSESNNLTSLKTTTTELTPPPADSTPAEREHAAAVARALLRNGLAPHAGLQPLPAELVEVAARLTGLGLPRKAAELAAAASPWPADKQREQIEIWQAYRRSKYARSINPGLFPQLVAARLSTGDECPHDTRDEVNPNDPSRFDSLIALSAERDDAEGKPADVPDPLAQLWRKVLGYISFLCGDNLPEGFAKARLAAGDAPGAYQIICVADWHRAWLERQGQSKLKLAFETQTGQPATLTFVIDD